MPLKRPVPVSNAAHGGACCIANVKASSSGSLAVGTNVYGSPASTRGGGVPEMSGARFDAGAVATMSNAASATVDGPSVTEITTPGKDPAAGGVPDRRPLLGSKLAQGGRFWIVNARASFSSSEAFGVNAYALPASTNVGGAPQICGRWLITTGFVTARSNAGSDVTAVPS